MRGLKIVEIKGQGVGAFLMKKIYSGRIWVIILLSIIASQNTFATQTFYGEWERTSLRGNLYNIVNNNRRIDIEENQYAFTLTEEATVTIKQTSFEDTYLYLFHVDNSGQIRVLEEDDGGAEYINDVYFGTSSIHRTLSSGSYFVVPTGYYFKT